MMNDRNELIRLFEKMESERKKVFLGLEPYSNDILERKPNEDAWSVAEVIQHLTKAEDGALKYMQIKLKHGGHRKAGLSSALKQSMLNLAVSLPLKYKAPKVITFDESNPLSFDEAVKNWDAVREGLRKEYETIDESLIRNELFKHPAAGKMNLIQSVKFMRKHVIRHAGQIERTVKAVSGISA